MADRGDDPNRSESGWRQWPADEGRALFAAANQPKKLVTFPGAGHNVFGSVGDRYLDLIEGFIREALKAPK